MEQPQPGTVPPPQGAGYPPQGTGYPPQGPGYPQQGQVPPPQQVPAPQPVGTTIVVTQPVAVTSAIKFAEAPVQMTCTNCNAQIVTTTTYETGTFAYLMAAILCLLGCWPCCLIPLFVDACKDVHHTCPNCKVQLGSLRRM